MACKPGPGTTHHLACDCREEKLAEEIAALHALIEEKDKDILRLKNGSVTRRIGDNQKAGTETA